MSLKFSIVTISFNQAKYLEQAILSVLNQDYSEVEYIVVDPGSTDGSREIIERYRDRIDKIVYRPDRGAAEGLNNGFALASGDIFGYLNSDDIFLPSALSRVARCFEDMPMLDIVMGHSQIIGPDGEWLRNSYTDRFDERAFAYGAAVFCQMSTFFRAELVKRSSGFNVHNRVAWDAEFFLDLQRFTHNKLLLDAFLSAFRIHPESVIGGGKLPQEQRRFFLDAFERHMGRPWQRHDGFIRLVYLVRKYLREPRSLWQRMRHGSILGRFKSRQS